MLILFKLTEEVFPFKGQAKAMNSHIVKRDSGESESTAAPCVPGVRVQRQTHDEEADHCEDEGYGQGHLQDTNKSTIH